MLNVVLVFANGEAETFQCETVEEGLERAEKFPKRYHALRRILMGENDDEYPAEWFVSRSGEFKLICPEAECY